MKLLWTTSDRLLSRVIRWATNSPCSHFAICFDEDDEGNGLVFHSGPRGTEILWLWEFLQSHRVVWALETWEPLPLEKEERIYKSILKSESGLAYDYAALLWWGWRALLKKFFWVPLPETNAWQSGARRLCTGIAPAVIKGFGIQTKQVIDFEMLELTELHGLFWQTDRFQNAKVPRLPIANEAASHDE